MAATPDDYGWRYTRAGRVRHLVHEAQQWTVCDRDADPFGGGWYGTGSQAEYERCAELPPCKKCLREVPRAAEWEVAT